MNSSLPQSSIVIVSWSWSQIEPYYRELNNRLISAENVFIWLADWSHLDELIHENYWRLYVATTVDTNNQIAQQQYMDFLDGIYPAAQAAGQKLKEKMLKSGFNRAGLEVPLRNMRAEAALFCQDNLPLLSKDLKLGNEYNKIIGAQTVEWDNKEVTLLKLQKVLQGACRETRESAWRLAAKRQLVDRHAINTIWVKELNVRQQLAENTDLPNYRAYRWQQLLRFDYSPQDCEQFHRAIEEVVVPVTQRIYDKYRRQLGVDSLRPWDLIDGCYGPPVDPLNRPPLRPFQNISELEWKATNIFRRVDPQFAEYFESMRDGGQLDLDNRKGKAPGGYCTEFEAVRRPFIFMNAVGIHDDVQTLVHEGGHAFHCFESNHFSYRHQRHVPIEFAELASMGMEFLARPYLTVDEGGFYNIEEAVRARVEHVERSILYWPYMAVVDAFQHWVYTHPDMALNPANCDACWAELWMRFMPGVDWSNLEQELITGWQRKGHIHDSPFYYIEYGLAQLGAMQIWRNARKNHSKTVAEYRRALSLGGTVTLPQLFASAGAQFAFDAKTLEQIIIWAMDNIGD